MQRLVVHDGAGPPLPGIRSTRLPGVAVEDPVPPEVLKMRAGDSHLIVDADRGGRLAGLRIGDREILLGPPDDRDRWLFWGSYLMAPWPGRLEGGALAWRGRRYALPTNHEGHAIHGLVFDRGWTIEHAGIDRVALSCDLGPSAWPFGGLVRQDIRLEPSRLTCVAEIVADQPMPAALGWHPWFERGGSDPRVCVDSAEVLETIELIPTGRTLPVDANTDLRAGPALGERRLDHTYVGCGTPATIRWPDLEIQIDLDPQVRAVVAHSPPAGFCVEPQTAWPNGLGPALAGRAEAGVRELAAGETWRVEMVWRWADDPPGR
jgi:aldose 1-epimerase